jgi:hypothetical protein
MSSAARNAWPLAAALLWAGTAVPACDPGTVSVELLDYDSDEDAYAFRVVDIETLDDVNRLEGRATSLVGDAELELNYQTNLLKWTEPGYHVAFGAVTSGGVLVPEDFDSLAMVSIYYHLERSLLYFEDIGFDSKRLVPMKTYYWPKFTVIDTGGAREIQADNAFYLYATKKERGFYVFPYSEFGWLPLSMNGGVMTHEFAHAVYDALVTVPNREWIDAGGLSLAASNFVYALNEGVADTIAVARLGDPDYMSHSIAAGTYVSSCNGSIDDVVRNASLASDYTEAMDDAARTTAQDAFCPYEIGAFVSSLMYETERRLDGLGDTDMEPPSIDSRERVSEALVRALDQLGQSLSSNVELWDFFDLFVAALGDGAPPIAACEVLSEYYTMYYGQIEGC